MADKTSVNKKFNRNVKIVESLPFLGMIAVIILFGVLTGGQIFNSFNLTTIWMQSFLFILGGLGMSFLFAQGAVDLSAGAVIALASIYGSFAANTAAGVAGCLLTCIAIGTLCGTGMGFLYSKTTIPVFVLGLSASFLIKGLLYRITDGSASVAIPVAQKRMFSPIWISVVFVILYAIVIFYFFQFRKMGKHSRAIGAGVAAAAQSGVNVDRTKLLAFVISGFTCGLVAFFTVMKTGAGGPASGTSFEFNVMIAMILGGMPSEGGAKAKIRACFIGALLLAVYSNGMVMLNVDSRLVEIIKGVIFIIVMVGTRELTRYVENNGGKKKAKKAAA